MNKDRAPHVFMVLVLSIIVLSLAGAAMIMGSMIYQFSRGEKLFVEKSSHTEMDSLTIHQGKEMDSDDIAGSDAAATVNHATVVVNGDNGPDMGVIISSNGYLIAQDIEGSVPLSVELDDGSVHSAKLVTYDPLSGLSLLKIPDESLRAALFAAEAPPVGSRLYKISYYEGEFALFEGIVSSERTVGDGLPVLVSDIPECSEGFSIFVNSEGEILAAGHCPVDELRSGAVSGSYIKSFLSAAGAD